MSNLFIDNNIERHICQIISENKRVIYLFILAKPVCLFYLSCFRFFVFYISFSGFTLHKTSD